MTEYPAATIYILPTVAALAGPLKTALPQLRGGVGLSLVLDGDDSPRKEPIGFCHTGRAVLIDHNLEIVDNDR